ncbi:uncharacterized protein Z518_09733 [Rhinocladiella mackenziei CBS 650.93]|uniref:Zn(2)-C6 fungal-type domain-containing protein n=1 Tax=Rhinocladiella mackenziei CBS 650.93 TaxID=1442369 RepID=A0A0D2GQT4_9EURO|nr:uncharacterized protein Z518_09733 [Rhinocladiella mackenziei CBS 650.93]KIX00668.1 hypothetical protein Z518_09733 [Rhinocladiella mackenziei CBS 650.93]
MSEVSHPARKKVWHPKVFSGCIKCKQRHVKCDEKKPACLRCIKLGVKCPGYRLPVPRIFDIRPRPRFDTEEDKVSYDYFVTSGSKVICNFQQNSLQFWTRLAPQLAETNDAVRHALVALGALQEPLHRVTVDQLATNRRPEISPLAIAHTTKAIHQMRIADPKSLCVEVAVSCCILFLALSIWMEKTAGPPIHILAAHRILKESTGDNTNNSRSKNNDLSRIYVPMVDGLIVHACTFTDQFPPPSSGIPPDYLLQYGLDGIGAMSNMPEALHAINTLLKSVLRATYHADTTSNAVTRSISSAISCYGRKLEDLRAANKCSEDLERYYQLRLHHRMAYLMFHTLGHDDEWIYDGHYEGFYFILEQSRRIIKQRDTTSAKTTSALNPTFGLIPPLFFVATKCRDSLRRQALQALHSVFRNERGWTSCMATTIAKFVIQEEEQTVDYICEEQISRPQRRIRLDQVEFSSAQRKMHLKYTMFTKKGAAGQPRSTRIPYCPHPSVESDGVTSDMSRKVLRACGYTSIILFTPPIECHCPAFQTKGPLPRATKAGLESINLDEVRWLQLTETQ